MLVWLRRAVAKAYELFFGIVLKIPNAPRITHDATAQSRRQFSNTNYGEVRRTIEPM